MTTHLLKLKQPYFDAVATGEKTFELRSMERDYKVGDILSFSEIEDTYSPDHGGCAIEKTTGRQCMVKVNYIVCGRFGLQPGYCCMGISLLHPYAHRIGMSNGRLTGFVEIDVRFVINARDRLLWAWRNLKCSNAMWRKESRKLEQDIDNLGRALNIAAVNFEELSEEDN